MRDAGGVSLHHLEIWVPDLAGATQRWGWLLHELGWVPYQEWERGRSWRDPRTGVYTVLEQSGALVPEATHNRMLPGLNHVAFAVGPRERVDVLADAAGEHGWSLLFSEKHPYAGGPAHYAAYLEDIDGYEVELVAADRA